MPPPHTHTHFLYFIFTTTRRPEDSSSAVRRHPPSLCSLSLSHKALTVPDTLATSAVNNQEDQPSHGLSCPLSASPSLLPPSRFPSTCTRAYVHTFISSHCNTVVMLPPVPGRHGLGTKKRALCFFPTQTCNRCSFSVDVPTAATLLRSRFPTLPAKRVEMNFSPALFLCCSRMCHRRRLSSLSYFSTLLCARACFPSFYAVLPPSRSLSPTRTHKINRPCCLVSFSAQTLLCVCLFAFALLRWERCNLFLLYVTSV